MFEWIDDIPLLEELQAGNVRAFNECYNRYRTGLKVYACSILQDEAEAQDVVQEFFIDLWEKQLYKNINTSVKHFLVVSIKNRCLNRLRDNDTRRKRYQEMQLPEDFSLPTYRKGQLELQQELSSAIEKEAPKSSRVFQLAYFEDMSYEEIAQTMGISTHTVKHQIVRALKILRTKFSKKIDKDSPLSA
jgi:RNA polymerase sigma-70 factor (family 1)